MVQGIEQREKRYVKVSPVTDEDGADHAYKLAQLQIGVVEILRRAPCPAAACAGARASASARAGTRAGTGARAASSAATAAAPVASRRNGDGHDMHAQERVRLAAVGVFAIFVFALMALSCCGNVLLGDDFLALDEAAPTVLAGVFAFRPRAPHPWQMG